MSASVVEIAGHITIKIMILGGTTQQIMIIIIILIRMCSINVATSRTLLLIDEHALVRTMQGGQKK